VSDVYEPYDRLIRLLVLGRGFDVPENNLVLRQLQFVAPDIGYGQYCWNAECRNCEMVYRQGAAAEAAGLACRIKGVPGMRIVKVAPEMRYSLSAVLAAAPPSTE